MKWRAVMLSGIGDDSSIHDGAVSNVPSSCSRVRAQHGRLICDQRTNSRRYIKLSSRDSDAPAVCTATRCNTIMVLRSSLRRD